MQVFIPYSSPIKCAEALYNDKSRFNKQIIECKQILDAINNVGKGWFNHPIVKMYRPYYNWLELYMYVLESYRKSKKSENTTDKDGFMLEAEFYSRKADDIIPSFINSDLCDQHKRRLYTKSPNLYKQFEEYGKSFENWYIVEGILIKYVDGKIVK